MRPRGSAARRDSLEVMNHNTCLSLALLACGGLLGLGACAGSKQDAAAPDGTPRITTSLVNASSVVSVCPDGKRMSAKAAAGALQKLVQPCASVPGGRAHFAATLLPGGKIELAAPDGNTAEGVVPTCVLRNALRHNVLLKSPCRFDVQLEERKVGAAIPADDATN